MDKDSPFEHGICLNSKNTLFSDLDYGDVIYAFSRRDDGVYVLVAKGKVFDCHEEDGQFIATNKHGEVWLDQMYELINDVRNPMVDQKFLNVEDKTCFFYKHIAISHGVKKPTKRIPYEWIFPTNFSLRKI